MSCSISATGSRDLIASFRLRLALPGGKGAGGRPLWPPLVTVSVSVLGLSGFSWSSGSMNGGGGYIGLQKLWPLPVGGKAPLKRLKCMTIV